MNNTQQLLQPNEHLIAKAKVNVGAVIAPIIVLIIGAALFFLNLGGGLDQLKIPGFLLLIIGVWTTVVGLSRRFTTELVLTDERILGENGLMPRKTMDAPLNKIDQIQVNRTLLGRVLGYGTLVVSISGSGRSRQRFQQISAPERVAQQIRDQASLRGKALR